MNDRAYNNRASNGIKSHGCRRKSQISVDGADRRIARVHGWGTLNEASVACSTVVVSRHARQEASVKKDSLTIRAGMACKMIA